MVSQMESNIILRVLNLHTITKKNVNNEDLKKVAYCAFGA